MNFSDIGTVGPQLHGLFALAKHLLRTSALISSSTLNEAIETSATNLHFFHITVACVSSLRHASPALTSPASPQSNANDVIDDTVGFPEAGAMRSGWPDL